MQMQGADSEQLIPSRQHVLANEIAHSLHPPPAPLHLPPKGPLPNLLPLTSACADG